jgi:hypothetical protein
MRLRDVEARTLMARMLASRAGSPLPQEVSRYSFPLEPESTPGTKYGWKSQANQEVSDWFSNPRLSGLWHSAITNYATAYTYWNVETIAARGSEGL